VIIGSSIASNGNIGIGNNVSPNANIPASLLHIRGTNPTITITGQGNIGATARIDLSSYDTGISPYTCSLLAVDDGLYSSTFMINLKTRGATTTSQFTAMTITSNGNIGIGTNNPAGKLEVAGNICIGFYNTLETRFVGHYNVGNNDILTGMEIESTTLGGNYSQKLHLRTHHYGTSQGRRLSIQENGNVVIGGNVNVGSLTNPSDSRIKKDIEDINDDTALTKLLLIRPTTYNYIDEECNKGFGKVYGFIAQQIKEIIPEAVPIIQYIIPNIYKSCLINNKREVYHSIPSNIPIDTEVKIRGSDYKIKEIYEDYFVIDKDIETEEAFVFGYSVEDFHTLNKDYIFTLNVCATQELHRRIEAQSLLIKSQDDRIKDLETKMERILSGTT